MNEKEIKSEGYFTKATNLLSGSIYSILLLVVLLLSTISAVFAWDIKLLNSILGLGTAGIVLISILKGIAALYRCVTSGKVSSLYGILNLVQLIAIVTIFVLFALKMLSDDTECNNTLYSIVLGAFAAMSLAVRRLSNDTVLDFQKIALSAYSVVMFSMFVLGRFAGVKMAAEYAPLVNAVLAIPCLIVLFIGKEKQDSKAKEFTLVERVLIFVGIVAVFGIFFSPNLNDLRSFYGFTWCNAAEVVKKVPAGGLADAGAAAADVVADAGAAVADGVEAVADGAIGHLADPLEA